MSRTEGSVDGVETLHGQLPAGDLEQDADRDAEVVRADRRMSGEDPDLWPCRVTSRVGGAAPDPGLPVELEDHLDVRELAEPVGGSPVQDRGFQDQSRHDGAPVVLEDLGSAAADHADRGQHDRLSHCRPGLAAAGRGCTANRLPR